MYHTLNRLDPYMNGHITDVVFDLGGVLIDWNPRYVYRELFENEEEMEWFLANICTSEWNAKQDAGRMFEEATAELLEKHPEHESLIRAYYDRWEDMLAGPIPGSVEILREVRDSSYGLYGLTNWSAESFPVARQRYDFLNWFEGIVVSGEICMIKPDPEIFEHLSRVFGLEPSASVFIDDVAVNVDAARAAGYRAIQFQNPDQLRSELNAAGVELEPIANQKQ